MFATFPGKATLNGQLARLGATARRPAGDRRSEAARAAVHQTVASRAGVSAATARTVLDGHDVAALPPREAQAMAGFLGRALANPATRATSRPVLAHHLARLTAAPQPAAADLAARADARLRARGDGIAADRRAQAKADVDQLEHLGREASVARLDRVPGRHAAVLGRLNAAHDRALARLDQADGWARTPTARQQNAQARAHLQAQMAAALDLALRPPPKARP